MFLGARARARSLPSMWARRLCRPSGVQPLVASWAERVARTGMADDASQRKAIELLAQWDADSAVRGRCALRPWAYVYGSVGSGKTMLLDHIAKHSLRASDERRASSGGKTVLRAHQHDFLLAVHAQLHALQSQRPVRVRKTLSGLDVYDYGEAKGGSSIDTLAHVAATLASRHELICLDELCVTDLADALLLGRLCRALLHEGVCLVFTSNQPPAKLFESGVNRRRYVGELSALLRARCVPVQVGSDVDYRAAAARRGSGEGSSALADPAEPPVPGSAAHRASGCFLHGAPGADDFERRWQALVRGHGGAEGRAMVPIAFSRRWMVHRTCARSMRARFDEVCGEVRGAADYLALARAFDSLHIDELPTLDPKRVDEARRLVTLVDVCYDNNVRLVLGAQVPLERLFCALREGGGGGEGAATAEPVAGELSWMLTRCMSRLTEMTMSRTT